MKREFHVRFFEGLKGKFHWATHQDEGEEIHLTLRLTAEERLRLIEQFGSLPISRGKITGES